MYVYIYMGFYAGLKNLFFQSKFLSIYPSSPCSLPVLVPVLVPVPVSVETS